MKEKRKWILPGGCMAAGMVLYLILTLGEAGKGLDLSGEGLKRDSYGGEEKEYGLLVEGLEEKPVPVTVTVKPQSYTEEEANQVFYQVMDKIEEKIRGENHSLMAVCQDLSLPGRLEEYGVKLRWYSSDPEVLSAAGRLAKNVKENTDVTLYVQVSHGSYEKEFQVPVRLVPPERTPLEEKLQMLKEAVEREDEIQKTKDTVILPGEIDGTPVSYRLADHTDYTPLPLLGIVLGLLLWARELSEKRNREKKREQELLLDYAEIVSKLLVFVGAGMTVPNAWERIVKDYQARKGEKVCRPAYEEMCVTYYQMKNGTSEGAALGEFGRRCMLQPYLKLSSLLEQNRKSGNRNLRSILEIEMAEAFELRKNLARQMGEEAGTKLLLPLFLMLGIIMVMIMVPAMMTMG